MSDLLKIVTTGLEALNLVQDNVQQALPDRSDITEGVLLENVSFPGTVNHGLGRQALGAIVLKQSDGANFEERGRFHSPHHPNPRHPCPLFPALTSSEKHTFWVTV